ncbi:DeoR/GlpR family DNA-binding transcription regulator [Ornithinimicrobium faecis]|uniref:DeoR/GlpR family DNA-binding transcription regulator n=1 Tax=Ornithinimicrobium faecis TaxID=2934158 RepID=A0ABY4YSN7_9MICO|nr:DeoR/GlpR family DNA-binding transcription regulator [Ornithinimicrobium sp. HY1793]USQ79167.1 DeoR/GlpR family DNA-binding transcription regulator [Ornithinimicrobium sp. HY1793]
MATGKRTRQEAIFQAISQEGRVDVSGLAVSLDVSAMTIRRDMAELSNRGLINRVHGGATSRQEPALRAEVMRAEKLAMARWVVGGLVDDQFLALDVGSTCTAIAEELNVRGNVTVLSNSLEALHVLRSTAVERLCVAGQINGEGSIIPHDVSSALEPYALDKVILGCGGVSAARGVTYHEVKETFFRRALIERASEVILVADHTKLGRESSFSLGRLALIDKLVTTREPDRALADSLAEAGVQVDVVSVGASTSN